MKRRIRYPFTQVRGFKAFSIVHGTVTVEPDWINKWKGPEEGGGPGLFSRMRMATWIEKRLNTRPARAAKRKERGR